jgi:predicted nucleic acid-binding protein
MIVLDTSVVIAYLVRTEPRHEEVADWIDRGEDDFVSTPLALAEMDHLIRRMGRERGGRALREEVRAGAFRVLWWDRAVEDSLDAIEHAGRPEIGLTDASLMALARFVRTNRIATLDERHFRWLRPLTGEPAFTILPADAL